MTTTLTKKSPRNRQHEFGQFLTPVSIAKLMASQFEALPTRLRLLDPGAGAGALSLAVIQRACAAIASRPESIEVVAYELDSTIIADLERTLSECRRECRVVGIEFKADVVCGDFIEAASAASRRGLWDDPCEPFDLAILNPPYGKISSDSSARHQLREAGIETSNLYTGFLALAMQLLKPGGELVSITPRSFCNGPYFRPFRQQFLAQMSLRRLHVFASRSAAFERDRVLQENIIVHAVKSVRHPTKVLVSSSSGDSNDAISERRCRYDDVVSPDDPEQFIHLPSDQSHDLARQRMESLPATLADIGLSVSTGRVVDFRVKEFLRADSCQGSVPLIYPCHFSAGYVAWPKSPSRKPNAIQDVSATCDQIIPSETHVLVKRFSAKEERRRVVAAVFDPTRLDATRVGFENHLNYFHAAGCGLDLPLAIGLAAFLNSTPVDLYFRQFNGHTQVNATDLRQLRYPSRKQLTSLGKRLGAQFPEQDTLDAIVVREVF